MAVINDAKAVINHEETIRGLSKAITKIADVLPRIELSYALYSTIEMKEAVAYIYAKIIEFFQSAVKWYKNGKLKHSISSILKPYSLSFEPIIDEINEQSRQIDKLANATLKIEVRKIHKLVFHLCQITDGQVNLQNQMASELREMKQSYQLFGLEKIQELPMIENLLDPLASLNLCRSLRRRRRLRAPRDIPIESVNKFKKWLTSNCSSTLLAEGRGIKTSAKDFAIDILDTILQNNEPVIWFVSDCMANEEPVSLTEVLASLIMQSLRLNSSPLTGANPVTTDHFKPNRDPKQLFQVLQRCLQVFPRICVVIDLNVIEKSLRDNSFRPSAFIEQVQQITESHTPGILKVLFISWKFEAMTLMDAMDVFGDDIIITDKGLRAARLARNPKHRAMLLSRQKKGG